MQESDRSDLEWVLSAAAGDRNAFASLVRRHQRPLYRYLARIVGSSEEALELTQDALVRAWQALPQWTPQAGFRTWLFRIGRNAAVDLLRRRGTVDFVALDNAFEGEHAGAGPERQVQAAQQVRRLEAGLGRLSAEHREVLVLREIEEMSYAEIGRVLSVSEGTVKSRLARARAALIALLGSEDQ